MPKSVVPTFTPCSRCRRAGRKRQQIAQLINRQLFGQMPDDRFVTSGRNAHPRWLDDWDHDKI